MKKVLRALVANDSAILLLWHKVKAFCAALYYGFPARKLVVIGVTGTDGKTTTVGMIAHILHESDIAVGALSTAYFRIKEKITWNATQKTSPSPFIVQKFLRDIVDAGCTHAVLECSSHGLIQGRVSFTWPLVAAITNLSEEHLDYHKTMTAYLQAKSLLFRMLPEKSGVKVLNVDDRSYGELSSIPTAWTFVYSRKKNLLETETNLQRMSFWATNIQEGHTLSAELHVSGEKEPQKLQLPLAGAFNIDNALCAICCCKAVGIDIEVAAQALTTFQGVPGRMERIPSPLPFTVYIDFTVTPQSYESTLSTLRTMTGGKGRILALAGSCGDRMKEKRPIVGGILSRMADISYITNEDPYTENPGAIIDDVLSGYPKDFPIFRETLPKQYEAKPYCMRVSDRMKAIQMILREAKNDDIVLLCGKGSDTTMMLATGQIPWNERDIVSEELSKIVAERSGVS